MISSWTFALLTLLVAGWTPVHAQIVAVGLVTDQRDGHAVSEVSIVLSRISGERDSVVVATGTAGRFAAILPGPGTYALTARREGYELLTFSPIEATEGGGQVELFVDLTPTATEIEGIDVEVEEERRATVLERSGFFNRERRGFGVHINPTQMERRRYSMKSAFRGIAGVTVTPDERLRFLTGSGTAYMCRPNYYLDGSPQQPGSELLDFTTLQDILAMEVYRRASETPVEYRRSTNGCGVVLLWTGR